MVAVVVNFKDQGHAVLVLSSQCELKQQHGWSELGHPTFIVSHSSTINQIYSVHSVNTETAVVGKLERQSNEGGRWAQNGWRMDSLVC